MVYLSGFLDKGYVVVSELQVCSVSIMSLCFVDSPTRELCVLPSSRDRGLDFLDICL